jgi:hypothetical protein
VDTRPARHKRENVKIGEGGGWKLSRQEETVVAAPSVSALDNPTRPTRECGDDSDPGWIKSHRPASLWAFCAFDARLQVKTARLVHVVQSPRIPRIIPANRCWVGALQSR